MSQPNKGNYEKILENSWKVFEKWESESKMQKSKNSKYKKTQQVTSFIFLFIFYFISICIILICLISRPEDTFKGMKTQEMQFIMLQILNLMNIGALHLFYYYRKKYRNPFKYKKNESPYIIDSNYGDHVKEKKLKRLDHLDDLIQ